MRIYICDDCEADRKRLRHMVQKYVRELKVETAEIVVFSSAAELVKSYTEDAVKADILFMDIYMEGMDGMEAAKTVRDLDGQSKLVFVTSSNEHGMEAFSVYADGYLKKPFDYSDFSNTMWPLRAMFLQEAKKYTYSVRRQEYSIYYCDILYIESDAHATRIHTEEKEIRISQPLKTISKDFLEENNFLWAGKSYMVNMDRIKRFEGNMIELDGGKVIYVPIRVVKEFGEELQNYRGH